MHLEGVTGLNEVLGGVDAIFKINDVLGIISKMMHFSDVLGVMASILIVSSGVNLPNYLSSEDLEKCSSTGVYLHWLNTSSSIVSRGGLSHTRCT